MSIGLHPRRLRSYTINNINQIPQLQKFSKDELTAMKAIAHILPFRTNNYVIEELIDWDSVPNDPMFRLNFPHPAMLPTEDLQQLIHLINLNAGTVQIQSYVDTVRRRLNPCPSGQQRNIPSLEGEMVPGVQHKYRETLLIFPSAGQTCHVHCTFCFRWTQFVGLDDYKFMTGESQRFQDYIRQHKELTDVLWTGGDPITMSARHLSFYIEPLLAPDFEHICNIRIGTKSIASWPHRFVTDPDADELLRLFEKVVNHGKLLVGATRFCEVG